jgi:tetratricopeptide (TPR) repeat protein
MSKRRKRDNRRGRPDNRQPTPQASDHAATAPVAPSHTPAVFRAADVLLVSLVVVAALSLRLIYIEQLRDNPLFDHPVMDEAYHDQWGQAIAEGRRFVDGPYFRAPLYPALLGAIYTAFGHNLLIPRIIQAVLGSVSCGLIFLIGRRAFGRTAGAAAGFAAASYWMLIYFDGELLIPTLIVFLDLLLIWLLLRVAEKPGHLRWGMAGVVLGLTAIARPNVLLFAPAIALWQLVLYCSSLRRFAGYFAATLAGCLLVVLPMTIRNYVVGNDLVLISSQGGVNFYIGNNAQSDGRTAIVPGTPGDWWEGYRATVSRAEQAAGRTLKPSEVSDYYYAEAFDFIRNEPKAFLSLLWLKLRLSWTRWELSNNKDIYFWSEQMTPLLSRLPLGFGLVGPLGIVGLALCWRRRCALFPIWGFVLVYMVGVVMFFCTSRYRMPVVALLIVLAAYALVECATALRHRNWSTLALAVISLAVALPLVHVTPNTKPFRNDAFAYTRLGAAYARQGRSELAEEYYSKALEAAPHFLTARLNYGKLLQRTGRLDEAVVQFRRATEAESSSLTGETVGLLAEAHFQLAHALGEQGTYTEAAAHYRTAMQLDPTCYPGWVQYNRAVALEQAGTTEEAAVAYAEAVEPLRRRLPQNPNDAALLFAIGRSLLVTGRYRDSIPYLQRCLAADPNHNWAARLLDRAEALVGQVERRDPP